MRYALVLLAIVIAVSGCCGMKKHCSNEMKKPCGVGCDKPCCAVQK